MNRAIRRFWIFDAAFMLSLIVCAAAAGNIRYTYDDLGRLKQIDYDNGMSIVYTYDDVGNRLSRRVVLPSASGCDLNSDGEVTVLDVQLVVNLVLGTPGSGDVNGDGRTDVLDVQALINVVMGAPCPQATPTTTAPPATTTSTTSTIASTTSTIQTTSSPTSSTTTSTVFIPTTAITTTSSTSTTTTSTSTTTTTAPTTTTTLPITTTTLPTTTTTLPPTPTCDLFEEDFDRGIRDGWAFDSTMAFTNGKLQALTNFQNAFASAVYTGLPAPNFFRIVVDIDIISFNGTFYGIQPFSSFDQFLIDEFTVNGVGATVLSDRRVAFLAQDTDLGWVFFDAISYLDPIRSLGVEWTDSLLKLIVNDEVVQTRLIKTTAPYLDRVALVADGTSTLIHFDNLCQSSLAADGGVGLEAMAPPKGAVTRIAPFMGLLPSTHPVGIEVSAENAIRLQRPKR